MKVSEDNIMMLMLAIRFNRVKLGITIIRDEINLMQSI